MVLISLTQDALFRRGFDEDDLLRRSGLAPALSVRFCKLDGRNLFQLVGSEISRGRSLQHLRVFRSGAI